MIVAALLLLFAAQNVVEMRQESCTSDELIKLTAGYTYLLKGDFRLNTLHPPLLKLFSALPLLVLHPKIDFSDPSWNRPINQWKFSAHFLYSNNADQILFWGRLPVILLTTALGYFIFRWAQQLYGNFPGIFALALFCFSPTFIAHSHWVTLDAGVAALLTISLYLLWRFARSGKKLILLWSALAMAAALGSKYLAFAMLPGYALLLGAIYQFDFLSSGSPSGAPTRKEKETAPRRRTRKDSDAESSRSIDPEGIPSRFVQRLNGPKIITLLVLVVVATVGAVSLLAYFGFPRFSNYFIGLAQIKWYRRPTFPFYLHGTFVDGGAWYFFTVTFLVKATAPFLILIFLRLVMFFWTLKLEWRDSIFLILPSTLYFALVSVFANPIGVRYLLPVFSLLMIFSSGLISQFAKKKIALSVLWILLGWHITSSLVAFPNHLSYFNEFVGGPSHGTDWLDDSNVDWGQELKTLKEVLDKRGIQAVTLISFSPYDNPEYYSIRCIRPPQEEWPGLFEHPHPGTYVISAHWLARAKGLGYDWKLRYPVIADVGNSMFVFQIP
ncbi:MAG: glycosyltransferase family 39 protein [Acidobacteriia bacterium]|nr:glycosyltransferase family 39 protein [Terriglobia bacterium]